MNTLKTALKRKIEEHRPRTARLLKDYGDVKVGEVTIEQIIGGMRDIKSLVTDISYLDPQEGIRFRGKTIAEVIEMLPKPKGADYPYVESFWFYLLTGEVPNEAQTQEVICDFTTRRVVPQYVFDVLRAMPKDMHPMVMFSTAILAMQHESTFSKWYEKGFKKLDAWEPMYEDASNILAKLPIIAAFIYRLKYKGDQQIKSDYNLPFGADFAHMMGIPAPYDDVSRLYFLLHADHESGNVSAHATHLVGSALSDAYYSLSAGMNGLAGPLHGLATQEVLRWLQDVMEKLNGAEPTEELMKKFVEETLDSGQVIPGFGHAVLRKTDPRYTAQREFCEKHLPNDPIFKYVDMLYKVVPPILLAKGKAKNPWPNVDAQSGVLQWHYGVTEFDFYTVMFGVGRAIGVLANLVWSRGLGYALERPKSLTTDMLEEIAGIKK
ncbi:MAG TPA: type I citrate synthase [Bacteroidales bacterium]|nr:type I citrate synthase [Bacteroidales bacterium]